MAYNENSQPGASVNDGLRYTHPEPEEPPTGYAYPPVAVPFQPTDNQPIMSQPASGGYGSPQSYGSGFETQQSAVSGNGKSKTDKEIHGKVSRNAEDSKDHCCKCCCCYCC